MLLELTAYGCSIEGLSHPAKAASQSREHGLTTTADCQNQQNPSVQTLSCSSSDLQSCESSGTRPRSRQIRGETDRLDLRSGGGAEDGGGVLTTMTLKRLASLGGSDDPMAAAGAARRDAWARTLGRGEEGEGFWRREVEGGWAV